MNPKPPLTNKQAKAYRATVRAGLRRLRTPESVVRRITLQMANQHQIAKDAWVRYHGGDVLRASVSTDRIRQRQKAGSS